MHRFRARLPLGNFFLQRLIAAARLKNCGTGGGTTTGAGDAGSTSSRRKTSRTASLESGSRLPAFDANAADPASAESAGRKELSSPAGPAAPVARLRSVVVLPVVSRTKTSVKL